MLERLKAETDLSCNSDTFRRIFSCLSRKAGVDTIAIISNQSIINTLVTISYYFSLILSLESVSAKR